MASVPQDRAEACVTALRQAGCESASIVGTFKVSSISGSTCFDSFNVVQPPNTA